MDTLTSRRFREGLLSHPYKTTKELWVPEDPMLVLRTDPPRDGDERARAMKLLKEPLLNKGSQEDQDAIIDILSRSAISDPSPVIRMEAIGALGRFQDPRTTGVLITAYRSAHGYRGGDAAPPADLLRPSVITAGMSAGRAPTTRKNNAEPFPLSGPTGFQPEWVTAIRCRAVESLGRSNRAEAAKFLALVAGVGGNDVAIDGGEDRDVRLAAIRGLGHCRQPEAVIALAQVLNQEATVQGKSRDTALIGRTHEGLVRLTGKKLPPDPQQWGEVVQTGVVIAPEPPWWENTIQQTSAWIKQR